MNDTPYKVELLTPEESAQVFRHLGKEVPESHRRIYLPSGIELRGSFQVTARNVESQKVEWDLEQDNLITDSGRRGFAYGSWRSGTFMGFAPSKETPTPFRYSIGTDTAQAFDSSSSSSGSMSPSVNPVTYTKQFGTITWNAPSSNRTLGTIALMSRASSSTYGLVGVLAFALLSPSRVQTTTQTLEVIYKISMTPIY